ncbi:MAG: cobalamin biosynthesis protein [Roseibium sp.]|nr:cobalamin biosynthesis protein [Roseibium sp.]
MLIYENALWLLLAALVIDAVIGDPDWLWRRLPHPVVWIGSIVSTFDRLGNRDGLSAIAKRRNGVLALLVLVIGAAALGAALHAFADLFRGGNILVVLIAAVLIAQNSLFKHVAAVRNGLRDDGLEGGRAAVAMIVGRDPEQLDEAGVSRAAIESCAENFSDGVVAPVFWFALLGLPGLIAYKAVNTADSMIGHRNEKYADFGWASARFDDLVNLPASRLSGFFIALSAPLVRGSFLKSMACIFKDARKHRSPNAGWPEAAMAGALDVALAGPRTYPGYTVDDPYLNEDGDRDISAREITRALAILVGACLVQAILIFLVAAETLVWTPV